MHAREAITTPAIEATTFESLEMFARSQIQTWLQELLEEEVGELLGRDRYQRRGGVDVPLGYRNGHGKPRRLSMSCGTITVRRPRVRGLEERFESRKHAAKEKWAERLAEIQKDARTEGDKKIAAELGDMHERHVKMLKAMAVRVLNGIKEFPLRSGMEASRQANQHSPKAQS